MNEAKPLTGVELRQKLKELNKEVPLLSSEEMAKRCGYYVIMNSNEIHVNMDDFYQAVLNIKYDINNV